MKLSDGVGGKTENFQEVRKNKENNGDKEGEDGWVKRVKVPFSDSAAS